LAGKREYKEEKTDLDDKGLPRKGSPFLFTPFECFRLGITINLDITPS